MKVTHKAFTLEIIATLLVVFLFYRDVIYMGETIIYFLVMFVYHYRETILNYTDKEIDDKEVKLKKEFHIAGYIIAMVTCFLVLISEL